MNNQSQPSFTQHPSADLTKGTLWAFNKLTIIKIRRQVAQSGDVLINYQKSKKWPQPDPGVCDRVYEL